MICREASALQPISVGTQDEGHFAAIGAGLYCGSIRKSAGRKQVFGIFHKRFPAMQAPTAIHPASTPFVLTPRVMQLWRLMSSAVKSSDSQEPVLVVGPEGCGKTRAIHALASVLHQDVEDCFLTPESEPTDLVGQQLPSDLAGPGVSRIQWTDGAATKAYKYGRWLLLDNMAQAEASVLERLNPLLEQPPVWLLTENAEIEPVKAKRLADGTLDTGPAAGYQLFATMTPPKQPKSTLSPALANRFTSVSMPPISSVQADFVSEVQLVASAILGDASPADCALAANVCWLLYTACGGGLGPQVSFRSLVRLLNSAYVLQTQHTDFSVPSALWTAYLITSSGRVPLDQSVAIADQVQQLLGDQLCCPDYPDMSARMRGGHVLSASRRAHAVRLLACIECNLPVLLEVCFSFAQGSPASSIFGSEEMPTWFCANMVLLTWYCTEALAWIEPIAANHITHVHLCTTVNASCNPCSVRQHIIDASMSL